MGVREKMLEDIVTRFIDDQNVLALWQGGSAATGYLDEYSDLDLMIACEDDYVESVFEFLEDYFSKEYGIKRRFRIPEPAWHGLSQCFYLLDNTPRYYYLDVAIVRRSVKDKFTAVDRHGEAIVYFDKDFVVDPSPTDEMVTKERVKKAYDGIVESDFLHILEVEKAIARGNYYEAYPKYFSFVARHLGTMLNIKYRPAKVDFGLRYGSRDYAKGDYELMEELMRVDSLEMLELCFRKALKRYAELKEEFTIQFQA